MSDPTKPKPTLAQRLGLDRPAPADDDVHEHGVPRSIGPLQRIQRGTGIRRRPIHHPMVPPGPSLVAGMTLDDIKEAGREHLRRLKAMEHNSAAIEGLPLGRLVTEALRIRGKVPRGQPRAVEFLETLFGASASHLYGWSLAASLVDAPEPPWHLVEDYIRSHPLKPRRSGYARLIAMRKSYDRFRQTPP